MGQMTFATIADKTTIPISVDMSLPKPDLCVKMNTICRLCLQIEWYRPNDDC